MSECAGFTKRRGVERRCGQRGYIYYAGVFWCYYHNPSNPKKFGQGYGSEKYLAGY